MGTRTHRTWFVLGPLAAAALFAMSWFLLISPQRAHTASLRAQTDDARVELSTQRHKLAELQRKNSRLAEYRATLAKDRKALPVTSDQSGFLRELQNAGDATNVSVSGASVVEVQDATLQANGVSALDLSVTVSGTVGGVDDFLDELQRKQPRAVLISNVAFSPAEGDKSGTAFRTTISLRIFYAPKAGAPATPSK